MERKLINTQLIAHIDINIAEPTINNEEVATQIKLFNKKHKHQYTIIIPGEHTKFVEPIETLLLNRLNDKIFISIDILKQAIIDRIKQAQKAMDEYENKE